jgi:hypothetical protein
VGKIAAATPVTIARGLELFLADMVQSTVESARLRASRTLTVLLPLPSPRCVGGGSEASEHCVRVDNARSGSMFSSSLLRPARLGKGPQRAHTDEG